VSPKALINGVVKAQIVVVNGKVEGPIVGQEVLLKSQAFVTGDIQAQTLLTEPGAHFEGRSSPELLGL
jgi:cytoskeletal protein CcmA (bactofilin family)